jgi:hypothetical protein
VVDYQREGLRQLGVVSHLRFSPESSEKRCRGRSPGSPGYFGLPIPASRNSGKGENILFLGLQLRGQLRNFLIPQDHRIPFSSMITVCELEPQQNKDKINWQDSKNILKK